MTPPAFPAQRHTLVEDIDVGGVVCRVADQVDWEIMPAPAPRSVHEVAGLIRVTNVANINLLPTLDCSFSITPSGQVGGWSGIDVEESDPVLGEDYFPRGYGLLRYAGLVVAGAAPSGAFVLRWISPAPPAPGDRAYRNPDGFAAVRYEAGERYLQHSYRYVRRLE